MKTLALVSKRNQRYTVSLPDPRPDLVSAYVFAFARSGSTLLNNMIAAYCQYIDVPIFSLFNAAFDQGINTQDIQSDATDCFEKHGYIYTGFRHFPAFDMDITDAPSIWLVRDPRDMLVSLYYSLLKSHVIPKGLVSMSKAREDTAKVDINQFVIKRAKSFATQFPRYRKKLSGSDLKIYRYEDVIYDKHAWLTDVVTKLGIEYHQKHIHNIASHFDVIPQIEDQSKHVRQVHPGNHTSKLTQQTIAELNEVLADFLEYFDYAT